MGTTTPAVKSALQRARARLKQAPPEVPEPVESGELSRVLEQYIAAVEEADGAALERLLRVDAKVEATPWRTWFSGRATCVTYLVRQVLGSRGDWRLLPASANGQPAAIGYLHGRACGILVLTVTPADIARVNAFAGPELVAKFGSRLPVDPAITHTRFCHPIALPAGLISRPVGRVRLPCGTGAKGRKAGDGDTHSRVDGCGALGARDAAGRA
jgi:hypothetical protein